MMFSGAVPIIDVPCHQNVNKFIAKKKNKLVVYLWCSAAPASWGKSILIHSWVYWRITDKSSSNQNIHGHWILAFEAVRKKILISYVFVHRSTSERTAWLSCEIILIRRPKAKQPLAYWPQLWTNINWILMFCTTQGPSFHIPLINRVTALKVYTLKWKFCFLGMALIAYEKSLSS